MNPLLRPQGRRGVGRAMDGSPAVAAARSGRSRGRSLTSFHFVFVVGGAGPARGAGQTRGGRPPSRGRDTPVSRVRAVPRRPEPRVQATAEVPVEVGEGWPPWRAGRRAGAGAAGRCGWWCGPPARTADATSVHVDGGTEGHDVHRDRFIIEPRRIGVAGGEANKCSIVTDRIKGTSQIFVASHYSDCVGLLNREVDAEGVQTGWTRLHPCFGRELNVE